MRRGCVASWARYFASSGFVWVAAAGTTAGTGFGTAVGWLVTTTCVDELILRVVSTRFVLVLAGTPVSKRREFDSLS